MKALLWKRDMENRIKEQLMLFSDAPARTTSQQSLRCTALRSLYVLLQMLRRLGLAGTECQGAMLHHSAQG